MSWHAEGRVSDGVLYHPSDSKAWKHLDEVNAHLKADARNIRLGLASDRFNPFRNSNHSTWPIIVVPYNLPSWMCMKQDFFMISLIIPGPKQLGNDIDVYTQALVDELKEL